MREFRTFGSVGAPGEQFPGATRLHYGHGWIRHSFTSEVNNKVCLKLENVEM